MEMVMKIDWKLDMPRVKKIREDIARKLLTSDYSKIDKIYKLKAKEILDSATEEEKELVKELLESDFFIGPITYNENGDLVAIF
jgi:hypothetical protein